MMFFFDTTRSGTCFSMFFFLLVWLVVAALPGDQAGAESLARAFGLHKSEAEFLAQRHNEMFALRPFWRLTDMIVLGVFGRSFFEEMISGANFFWVNKSCHPLWLKPMGVVAP